MEQTDFLKSFLITAGPVVDWLRLFPNGTSKRLPGSGPPRTARTADKI